jgi:hypothetical protein
MRKIYAVLFAMLLIGVPAIGRACPAGYVDCGRGVCCPQ